MQNSRTRIILLCLYFVIERSQSSTIDNTRIVTRVQRCAKSYNEITCTLPAQPYNGKWTIIGATSDPGKQISVNTVLKYDCDPGYKLSNKSPYVVCDQNWKTYTFPECERLCPPKYSTSTTILKCENKYGREVPCDEAVDGTYLSYSCIPFYETPLGYKKTILCVDGTWNYPNPVCQPVCGKKIDKGVIQLAVGGTKKDHREYPWIIAVFQRKDNEFENICGGSLVSQRVIITAAHCVANDFGNGLSPGNFMVGAGKYYNKYKDPREVGAQYSKVARIVIQPGYKGASQRFLADIALLITKDLIAINEVIQPICYQDLPSIHLQAGKIGVVAGWGKTETGEQPDELRTLEIPYKYEMTCVQELPADWASKFSTNDKMCAGFFNQNKSVCTGDSGSGLYFQNPEDNRYYIHGIVSVAPAERGECNPQQNSLYTKVAFYYDFVDREITKQYVQLCSLPPYPSNGKWIVPKQEKKPGDIVSSNTVLKVECDEGYALPTKSPFIDCESARVMPKCQRLCPKPNFPPGTNYNCSNEMSEEIDCTKAVHGSSLSYTCPVGYKLQSDGEKVKLCENGSWGRSKPQCVARDTVKETPVKERKVVCSYASWYAFNKVLPEDLNTTLCTHIIYSFITLWERGDVRVLTDAVELDQNQKGLYRRFTDLKEKNKNLKVLLSVGSTDGSDANFFSGIASDEGKKTTFIYSLTYFIETYNFDGANIEWFYPKHDDMTNYVNLLKSLREKANEKGWLLTATVRSDPEDTGYDGEEMSRYLDWINIRTYDFYGPWSNYIGQNSALYPSSKENHWEKSHLNIEASGKSWVKFGMPKSKIVLSIAFYGRSFVLKDPSQYEIHSPFKGAGPGEGFLRHSEICVYKNWTSIWDDEQKSIISYHGTDWVGHESKDTVWTKAAYVKDNGFLGVNVWPLDGDDVYGKCGSKQILLKHVNGGIGNNVNFDS